MAPTQLQHRRTHNLLLISKLLNQRDAASPFTLVLDSLEQSAKPVVKEYIQRAKAANIEIIFVAFESLKTPPNTTVIAAWRDLQNWQKTVLSHLASNPSKRKLLILETLNPLTHPSASTIPPLLSTFLSHPNTSLLATFHLDLPTNHPNPNEPYTPNPLTLLQYLATTILTVHNLHHVLARKTARDNRRAEPTFGLVDGGGGEGVVQSLHANSLGAEAVVLEMEHRRRSGRGVREWFCLAIGRRGLGDGVSLLEDWPEYTAVADSQGQEDGLVGSTFELGLTERQRLEREGVVLPYYDAQKGGGAGEGGRILYDMGSEDDFDEEEDEI